MMKLTFQRTRREPWGNCHDCGEPPGRPWWYNWRKGAAVKVLCDTCYKRRLHRLTAARIIYGNDDSQSLDSQWLDRVARDGE